MYTSVELSPDELADVLAFQGLDPFSITTAFLRQHYAAVYYFSPEAFCYFLPGILSAGIRESEPDLLVYDALVASLDRSPEPEWWDGWFLDRWPHLTSAECEAVQSWLLWLTEFDNLEYYVNTLDRGWTRWISCEHGRWSGNRRAAEPTRSHAVDVVRFTRTRVNRAPAF